MNRHAYDEARRRFGDGAYVQHSRGIPDGKGFNIIDTCRIEGGRIAEHWDAIQPLNFSMRLFALFAGGRRAHDNSVF